MALTCQKNDLKQKVSGHSNFQNTPWGKSDKPTSFHGSIQYARARLGMEFCTVVIDRRGRGISSLLNVVPLLLVISWLLGLLGVRRCVSSLHWHSLLSRAAGAGAVGGAVGPVATA